MSRKPRRPERPSFDCCTCGACCAAELKLPLYVGVTDTDLRRLTPRWRARNVALASILTKVDPRGNCVCVALRGAVGNKVWCNIYERRPDACRDLEAGTPECIKARRQAGLEPPT